MDDLHSLTIELDDDLAAEAEDKTQDDLTPRARLCIGRPLRIDDFHVNIDPQLQVGELPSALREMLSSHLSIPALGSLRNWESIAAHLGLHNDEIMSLRGRPHACHEFLLKIWTLPARELVDALKAAHRLDTLVSLRGWVNRGIVAEPRRPPPSYSNATTLSAAFPSPPVTISLPADKKIILVSHFEGDDKLLRKEYNWLIKNIKAKTKDFPDTHIFQIDEIEASDNPNAALHVVFEKATHVVTVFSPAYSRLLKEEPNTIQTSLRHYLHRLMDAEFVAHGSRNERFRPVVISGFGASQLPAGWARCTLHYEFPARAEDLFRRLFDIPKNPLVTM